MIPNDLIAPVVSALTLATGHRGTIRRRSEPDGVEQLTDPEGRQIVTDMVARPSRPALIAAWQRVQQHASDDDAIPVIVVPHLTRSLRALADAERINWVDAAGNAHVSHPRLVLQIEGRPLVRRPAGQGTDPFSPRNANVVRQLLAEPSRAWRQKELIERTGISQPQVSKVLRALDEMALVERGEHGALVVTDPAALLDAWADAHRYSRQQIVPAHMTGDGIQLAEDLHAKLREAGVEHWFTGLPAAWAYDHFARFRLVSVFVGGDPDEVRRELGLREAPRGANLHLIATDGQRIDLGAAEPDGLPCAHLAQVYVDLLGLPERASEAADHLRPLALGASRA